MVQRNHLAVGFDTTDCCAKEVLQGDRTIKSPDKYPTVEGDTTTFTHHNDLAKSIPEAQAQHPTQQNGAAQHKPHDIVPGENAGLETISLQT